MTTSGITNINAKLIHQHPDNPRKDLGDLTELSESIKKKGIMQNLTVVPGHWDENRAHHEEGYTLIIGHRRFAAGKMAGVTMYPCRIVQDMSYKDQVGTMLEENMQRIDLTVLEQAEGFQMMLDLGDTEEQIAEKTGFSRTTVRRRLEIAKLDPELVKEKTDEDGAYQLNLKDLAELSRIEDVETRNRILKDAADSRQIKWKVEAEIKNKEREKNKKIIVKQLLTNVKSVIYYALATPIETPLTPAEIAAYKALTAYAPDTVVQASDGAGIKLDYQRDVNLVVKNLEDAIASMTTT